MRISRPLLAQRLLAEGQRPFTQEKPCDCSANEFVMGQLFPEPGGVSGYAICTACGTRRGLGEINMDGAPLFETEEPNRG